MNKQQEVLKLALEALEIGYEYAVETTEHFHIEMAGYKQHRHDAMDAEVKQISDAITAIREALAEQRSGIKQVIELYDSPEQPTQQEEPLEYWTVADGWVSEQAEVPAAAWIYPEFWDHCKMVGCGTAYRLPGDGRQPLYTSPPASKPWVGLTDQERREIGHPYFSSVNMSDVAYARAIEAKLREKNS